MSDRRQRREQKRLTRIVQLDVSTDDHVCVGVFSAVDLHERIGLLYHELDPRAVTGAAFQSLPPTVFEDGDVARLHFEWTLKSVGSQGRSATHHRDELEWLGELVAGEPGPADGEAA